VGMGKKDIPLEHELPMFKWLHHLEACITGACPNHWHRHLWGMGAHAPSTSNNLIFLS